MGFMIRVGMAIGGMLLSYFFGLNFLSNFATHLDSTGNVLVDIADGIGLVSKVKSFSKQLKLNLKNIDFKDYLRSYTIIS